MHKVRKLKFRNFSSPSLPPVRAHTILAYTPFPPSTRVRILFFKGDSQRYIFVNYYQSKDHK